MRLDEKPVLVKSDEGVGVITFNRPKVLNALSRDLLAELDDAVGTFEEDPGIGAIVFTGQGEKAFSAGADIHEMARLAEESDSDAPDPNRSKQTWHIAACTKPTIGAINGLAYGGGAVMASSFDIRIGCENTSFRFLAASYGRVNSTWSLPMQIGWPMAKELLFTARVVDAREAYRIGLLNHQVAADQLMLKAMEIGRQIASNDPRMVQGMKELILSGAGAKWSQMYENELEAQQSQLKGTPVLEGFKEFLDKKGKK